ncbi:hypothetical protein [Planctellipticum variicoloris]|uniref:hypothetical protein n=1 Tax=Planctellipticum variicoloris TaxID=3064265 RepID=UPI0030141590|nr:hypothetical protein SH412_000977 [Planctomycetaceae bacterium SH412]
MRDRLRQGTNGRLTLHATFDAIITRTCYLGETEVTIAQFRKSAEATGYVADAERFGGDLCIPKGTRRKDKDLNWRSHGLRSSRSFFTIYSGL